MPHPTFTESHLSHVRSELAKRGQSLVGNLGGQRYAITLLQEIGKLVPQYSGAVEHEVVYRPGNDDRAYSQSRNGIRPHTEAPGWDPSPRYLALYCHRQARCGGGHTDLLDGQRLPELLQADSLSLLTGRPLAFPGPTAPDGSATQVVTPMLRQGPDRFLLRFSFNLLTAGDLHAPLQPDAPLDDLPLGREGHALAYRVSDLFDRHRSPVLIPEDAVLIWDNQRMLHARSEYQDERRHLTRYWLADT
jgi:hypothetical protein